MLSKNASVYVLWLCFTARIAFGAEVYVSPDRQ